MNFGRATASLVVVALLCAGCGYFKAGTWEDDPKNWKRAFRSTTPPDVVVVHSKYWRSPHWTYEFQYFFEIVPTPELLEQLFTENELLRIAGAAADEAKTDFFAAPPDWFVPRDTTDYEVWIFEDEPRGHFRLFIDKDTGHVFLTDYQQ